jgi:protein-S-isoprenylcysteine O-methyltransferase Ste14
VWSELLNALELKVPPVALTFLFAALMWLSSVYSPLAVALPWRDAMAIIFCGVGLFIALAGILPFRQANTTVNPLTPEATTVMVTSGIYRFSRNPMYLGFFLALVGWATYLSYLLAFALLPLFVLYLNRFQILPEERILAAKFPHAFAAYRNSVHRWL